MIKVDGIYKGMNDDAYDFKASDGRQVTGQAHDAYIEVDDIRIKPKYRLKAVKLPKDYLVKAKIGDRVAFECDGGSGKFIFLAESKA